MITGFPILILKLIVTIRVTILFLIKNFKYKFIIINICGDDVMDNPKIDINSGDEIVLEKFGKKNKRPKINNYTEIFYFIKQYEEIRNREKNF